MRSNVDLGSFLFSFFHRGGDENFDDGDGDSWHSIIDTKK